MNSSPQSPERDHRSTEKGGWQEGISLLREVQGYAQANTDAARTQDDQDTWRARWRNVTRAVELLSAVAAASPPARQENSPRSAPEPDMYDVLGSPNEHVDVPRHDTEPAPQVREALEQIEALSRTPEMTAGLQWGRAYAIAKNVLDALSPVVAREPVGWKLVPIEPTQAMLDAVTASDQAPPFNDATMREVYTAMIEEAPSPTPSSAHQSAYRDVIDEALVVRHLGVAKGNAREELESILSWEVIAALDPTVSTAAQALIDQGKADASAVREALEEFDRLSLVIESAVRNESPSQHGHVLALIKRVRALSIKGTDLKQADETSEKSR